ncbi:MAG TPA: VOC family protein [Pyrinomonadaceae bacterium]
MADRVTPMIHVPNVQSTIDWYQRVGFTVNQTYDDGCGGELSFAILSFGATQVMFNAGGKLSTEQRREVDLYVHATGIDDLFARLKDQVEIIEGPHDTFYGMHEVIMKDLNGFWLTFGEPVNS